MVPQPRSNEVAALLQRGSVHGVRLGELEVGLDAPGPWLPFRGSTVEGQGAAHADASGCRDVQHGGVSTGSLRARHLVEIPIEPPHFQGKLAHGPCHRVRVVPLEFRGFTGRGYIPPRVLGHERAFLKGDQFFPSKALLDDGRVVPVQPHDKLPG